MRALQRSCVECEVEQVDFPSTSEPFRHDRGCVNKPVPLERIIDACPDCGEEGERAGHQGCQYPQDH